MTQTTEMTVEEKLRALYDLQLIDTKIDEIRNMRGELPLEVEDLDSEVSGISLRIEKIEKEIIDFEDFIKTKKNDISNHQDLIKKYTTQQKEVRNNREFDSLTKEIEYQELEIQLAEKNIKEKKISIEHKKSILEDSQSNLAIKSNHLNHKKSELDAIMIETQKEEEFLIEKSNEFSSKLDERLFNAYNRIRSNVRNGMAVVSIERGASAGSFFTIPPQVQVEIAARKKIMTDEHSGRILIDNVLAQEEREKMEELFGSI
jgi:predicted  nucleic acid-binding Zn-ribbon protein